jgi:peroxiredoxin Q/BCP
MLNEGDIAPDFKLMINDGSELVLSDLKGAPVVIYFYPKDNTSGCTKEALDFTEKLPEFKKLGIRIVGISPDSVKKHVNFIEKHDLMITLAADEDKSVAEQYGVWAEKKMYGRTYMGIIRSTFLIDENGRIAKIWRKVRVTDHASAVLEAAQDL